MYLVTASIHVACAVRYRVLTKTRRRSVNPEIIRDRGGAAELSARGKLGFGENSYIMALGLEVVNSADRAFGRFDNYTPALPVSDVLVESVGGGIRIAYKNAYLRKLQQYLPTCMHMSLPVLTSYCTSLGIHVHV